MALSACGGASNGGDNQGGNNTPGDNTNPSGGGGNNPSGEGGEEEAGWTADEIHTMKMYLYDVVLPRPDVEDVRLIYNQQMGCIQMDSYFETGDLAKYASKFDKDSNWLGGDISATIGAPVGCAYGYEREVDDHGQTRYVAVEFHCLDYLNDEPVFAEEGNFTLYASDPYFYSYEDMVRALVAVLGQAGISADAVIPLLSGVSHYLITPGDDELDPYIEVFVSSPEEDAGLGYALRQAYWTILEEKTHDDYTIAISPNSTAQIEYKYNRFSGILHIRFKTFSGWNGAILENFFTEYHLPHMTVPALNIDGAKYTFKVEDNYGVYTIKKDNLGLNDIVNYLPALRQQDYVIQDLLELAGSADVYDRRENDRLYVFSILFSAGTITFKFPTTETSAYGRVNNWPTSQIATVLEGCQDSVPAFAGNHAGFRVTNTSSTALSIDTYIDNDPTTYNQVRLDYEGLLGRNRYTLQETKTYDDAVYKYYISEHGDVQVGTVLLEYGSEVLQIGIRKIDTTPVTLTWPSDDVASAITSNLNNPSSITDPIPAMNMEDVTDVYVNTNFSHGEFEICVEHPSNDSIAIYERALDGAEYDFDNGYIFGEDQLGAWISEHNQIAIHLEYISGDLIITVKNYQDQGGGSGGTDPQTADWPTSDVNDYMGSYGLSGLTLPPLEGALEYNVIPTTGAFLVYCTFADARSAGAAKDAYIASSLSDFTYDDSESAYYKGILQIAVMASEEYVILVVSMRQEAAAKWPGDEVEEILLSWGVLYDYLPELESSNVKSYELQEPDVDNPNKFTIYASPKDDVLPSDIEREYAESLSYLYSYDSETDSYYSVDHEIDIYLDSGVDVLTIVVCKYVKPAIWPLDEITPILEDWGLGDEEVPILEDASITGYEVDPSDTAFDICVYNGASLISTYEDILDASPYTFDDIEEVWVSASEELRIHFYTSNDDLIIEVFIIDSGSGSNEWPDELLDEINLLYENFPQIDPLEIPAFEGFTDINFYYIYDSVVINLTFKDVESAEEAVANYIEKITGDDGDFEALDEVLFVQKGKTKECPAMVIMPDEGQNTVFVRIDAYHCKLSGCPYGAFDWLNNGSQLPDADWVPYFDGAERYELAAATLDPSQYRLALDCYFADDEELEYYLANWKELIESYNYLWNVTHYDSIHNNVMIFIEDNGDFIRIDIYADITNPEGPFYNYPLDAVNVMLGDFYIADLGFDSVYTSSTYNYDDSTESVITVTTFYRLDSDEIMAFVEETLCGYYLVSEGGFVAQTEFTSGNKHGVYTFETDGYDIFGDPIKITITVDVKLNNNNTLTLTFNKVEEDL